MRKYPTAKRLREVLRYEPETGKFFWLVRTAYATKIGDEAGSPSSVGYWRIQIDGQEFQAHILAWIYIYGRRPKRLDHEDLDKTNNRIGNLRVATPTQNNANAPKRAGTSSRFKGVCWNRSSNKWQAGIKKNGRSYHLGLFDQEEDAAAAYITEAKRIFGSFARAA